MRKIATIAVAGLLLSGCGGSAKEPASSVPVAAYTPTVHKVIYAAEGEGPKTASYTWRSPTGTEQVEADLPLATKDGQVGLHIDGFGSGDFLYLSVQNRESFGSVTCQIIVDGVEVSSNTSSGGYAIASCQGKVP
jgi:hypothetical protein